MKQTLVFRGSRRRPNWLWLFMLPHCRNRYRIVYSRFETLLSTVWMDRNRWASRDHFNISSRVFLQCKFDPIASSFVVISFITPKQIASSLRGFLSPRPDAIRGPFNERLHHRRSYFREGDQLLRSGEFSQILLRVKRTVGPKDKCPSAGLQSCNQWLRCLPGLLGIDCLIKKIASQEI